MYIYCFKISALRLRTHTCIHNYIYNSGAWTPNSDFMQSFLRTQCARFGITIAISTAMGCAYEWNSKLGH